MLTHTSGRLTRKDRRQELRRAFEDVDLDSYEVDTAQPLAYVARLHRHLHYQAINATIARIEKAGPSLPAARQRLMQAEAHHAGELSAERAKTKVILDWRELGLDQRLTIMKMWKPIEVLIMLGLVFLDFWVFARAIAIVLDVEPTTQNPEYWVGGALGLFISLLAWLLGRYTKRWTMSAAQRQLGGEIINRARKRKEPVPELPRRSMPDKTITLVFALMFFVLLALSFIMRIQASNEENIAVVAFQVLLPVLFVVFEYSVYDPLTVKDRPAPREVEQLRSQVAQETAALQGSITTMQQQIDQLGFAISELRDAITKRLRKHSLEPNDEVLQRVARLVDEDPAVQPLSQLDQLARRAEQLRDAYLRAHPEAGAA